MRHLLDPTNLTRTEVDMIINRALDIIEHPDLYAESCHGKKLATLFYEPSTRTRLSFTAAMMDLGGNVLGFSDAKSSSVSKGETVADTVRVVSAFADIIAMRHFKEGAPHVAAEFSRIPIINAGDGGHSHPTQTLTDLLTITRELGHLDNLTIGLCGDLKYGRTVHSLIKAMKQYENIHFILISPQELSLPDYIKNELGNNYTEILTLEEAIGLVDVLYMTRVQQERFTDASQYERLKNSFILNVEKMELAKSNMIVLHPLPRVNEIAIDVDKDSRAAYFRQVENGKFVRMALIYTLLQWKEETMICKENIFTTIDFCKNKQCISTTEPIERKAYIDKEGITRCFYCDHAINKE